MRNLSKKEWIAVAAAIVFVGYVLFGGTIMGLFQTNFTNNDDLALVGAIGSGVDIQDVLVGNGVEVRAGQLLSVNYVLSLVDGTVIQDSKDFGEPFVFVLGAGDVIPAWEIGLQGMRVGGVRTIVVPPELGYGDNQVGAIPPNSTLLFTIELLDAEDFPPQLVQ